MSVENRRKRRRTDIIATVVSCVAGLCAIAALAWSYSAHHDDLNKIAFAARAAAYDNRQTALSQCLSGNDSRVDNIRFIIDLTTEQQLLLSTGHSRFKATNTPQARHSRQVLSAYVATFKDHALQIARSVPAREALHPHSTDPEKRSLRDCAKVYPLPKRRGAPLPNPTVS